MEKQQIESMMTEAGQHNDWEQVSICALALNGDQQAIESCERAIAWRAAQNEINAATAEAFDSLAGAPY